MTLGVAQGAAEELKPLQFTFSPRSSGYREGHTFSIRVFDASDEADSFYTTDFAAHVFGDLSRSLSNQNWQNRLVIDLSGLPAGEDQQIRLAHCTARRLLVAVKETKNADWDFLNPCKTYSRDQIENKLLISREGQSWVQNDDFGSRFVDLEEYDEEFSDVSSLSESDLEIG